MEDTGHWSVKKQALDRGWKNKVGLCCSVSLISIRSNRKLKTARHGWMRGWEAEKEKSGKSFSGSFSVAPLFLSLFICYLPPLCCLKECFYLLWSTLVVKSKPLELTLVQCLTIYSDVNPLVHVSTTCYLLTHFWCVFFQKVYLTWLL